MLLGKQSSNEGMGRNSGASGFFVESVRPSPFPITFFANSGKGSDGLESFSGAAIALIDKFLCLRALHWGLERSICVAPKKLEPFLKGNAVVLVCRSGNALPVQLSFVEKTCDRAVQQEDMLPGPNYQQDNGSCTKQLRKTGGDLKGRRSLSCQNRRGCTGVQRASRWCFQEGVCWAAKAGLSV